LEFSADPAPPGAAGKLEWRTPTLYIPGEYLVKRGDSYGIFIVTSGKARFVPLPSADVGRPAAIDVPPATAIVVEGQFALTDGQSVSPGH
jgi:hypothetical protein